MIKEYLWEKSSLDSAELQSIEKEARHEKLEALLALASFYHRGAYGYPMDEKKAMRYMDEAMAKHYPQAFYMYAEWLLETPSLNDGIYFKALKFFERSANLGYGRAMARIGHFFLYGLGVKVDYVQAEKWLLAAKSHFAIDDLNALAKHYRELKRDKDAENVLLAAQEYQNFL
ncbi:MAG: hypothetical protein LKE36_00470 [Bacilli bacterium]|jgi:TPR repeat protein|nr:hypothetical protein [Bacilli bacterium]